MSKYQLILGDCLVKLKELDDNSVDSIVTDPPYGISFMGKKWDYDVPSVDIWKECLRVLKPGGHLLSFSGARTYHRMAVNIEDAGFEIRDQIMWVYGSGFPKSHNIGKKIPEYEGWGTALKPAHEPIVMARKPFKGTIADNVLEYGTGAINIEDCRVPLNGDENMEAKQASSKSTFSANANDWTTSTYKEDGRWPANFIHDGSEEVIERFPIVAGVKGGEGGGYQDKYVGGKCKKPSPKVGYNEPPSSAGRFFYCSKASKKDRNEGCEELEEKFSGRLNGRNPNSQNTFMDGPIPVAANHHPTVKPTELMRYLIRLVTPKNGKVLDPFMGSGSTGKAAILEDNYFIGIELDQEYFNIAEKRINHAITKIE